MKALLINFSYKLTKIVPIALVAAAVVVTGSSETALATAESEIREGVRAVGGSGEADLEDVLRNVINILLFIVGAAGVIMMIIGGFRYVSSNGDSSNITAAKNIILYSAVGIVVALSAFAIVNFILDAF